MHYKDHLGDTLRLREKVEEDRYFANVERMRRESDAQEVRMPERVAAQAPDEGACPRCGIRLAATHIRELEVHECPRCGGIWLDRMALRPFPGYPRKALLEYIAQYFRAH